MLRELMTGIVDWVLRGPRCCVTNKEMRDLQQLMKAISPPERVTGILNPQYPVSNLPGRDTGRGHGVT